jgi:multidrug resistance protein, MATE family
MKMTRLNSDLTTTPFTVAREIRPTLRLGWPIMVGNITQVALGVIDGVMVGSIHSSQLAAASFVSNVMMLPIILCVGLMMALAPLVSAARGRGEEGLPMALLYNGLLAGGLIALAMAIGFHWGSGLVHHLGQDPIVAKLARPYLILMAWRMIPMTLFMGLKSFADGLGKTKVAMYLTLSSMPLNVLLNYILIYGKWGAPRLELAGAGIGTLITQLILLITMGAVVFQSSAFRPYRQQLAQQLRFKMEMLRDIFKIGIPTGLQFGMESAAFAFMGIMAGWLGYQQQAAHQIGMYLSSLTFMVSLGISVAGSIRTGYAYGKQNWVEVRHIGKATLWLALAYGFICALFFIGGRYHIPLLFNGEQAVLEYAALVLLLTAFFQLSDALQATSAGLLRGVQDVRIPTFYILIAYWLIGVPGGYLLAFPGGWGIGGLWAGLVLGLTFSGGLLTFRFLRLTATKARTAGPAEPAASLQPEYSNI